MRRKRFVWLATVGVGGLLGLAQGYVMSDLRSPGLLAQTDVSAPVPPPAQLPEPAPPQATLTLEQRADVFMVRKAYADAVEYYRRALKKEGQANAALWNKLGVAYQQQMNFRAARNAYNEALRRRKGFSEAWNNLGTTYYLADKFKKSLKYYRRAIALNPNSAPLHINLGTSYYRLKRYPEAVEEYRTALILDPDCLARRSSLGTTVQARGADAEYFFYIAKVHASLGRAEDAVRYLRRAFEDGFRNLKRLEEDPDFQKIKDYPAYAELLRNPPVPIKD